MKYNYQSPAWPAAMLDSSGGRVIDLGVSGFEERPRRDDEDAHRPSAPEIPKRSDVTHREHQAEPRLRHTMKWKTVDIGPGCYYITGTITQWLPLLKRPDVRQTVYDDIAVAARDCGASITAFVSEFVSGTSSRNTDVIVSASDTHGRFSTPGITNVGLHIDDDPVESYVITTGNNSVQYTFDATSLDLSAGVHLVEAVAYDDYWNPICDKIQVRVTGTTEQSRSVGSVRAMSTGSAGSYLASGYVEIQTNNNLKAAEKYLDKLVAGGVPGCTVSQPVAAPVYETLNYWIGMGYGKPKDNTAGMNAVAWAILQYGQYKRYTGGPTPVIFPAVAGRPAYVNPTVVCNIVVADAYVLGNTFKQRVLRYDKGAWPISDTGYPIEAAQLAGAQSPYTGKSVGVSPLIAESHLSSPCVVAWGYIDWAGKTHGHCAIYITGDTIIEAHNGICFGSYGNDILTKFNGFSGTGRHKGIALGMPVYP